MIIAPDPQLPVTKMCSYSTALCFRPYTSAINAVTMEITLKKLANSLMGKLCSYKHYANFLYGTIASFFIWEYF